MSLLPTNHEEFRRKEYWDEFFIKRKSEAFEWYGKFADFAPFLQSLQLPQESSILVIGCGNSDLSADLYDFGYHNVTSIDFSTLVIEEMKQKNAVLRPEMEWLVMDMTMMIDFTRSDRKFDIVLDKGALDALMSVDSAETKMKSIQMFHEIQNVLKSKGSYLCITLAESYIASSIVDYFCTSEWQVDLFLLPNDPENKRKNKHFNVHHSLLLPFIVKAQKIDSSSGCGSMDIVFAHVDILGNPLPGGKSISLTTQDTLHHVRLIPTFLTSQV